MSRALLIALVALVLAPALAAAEGIRPFPLRTMETLGREVYERDKLAANAYDALFAAHPEARTRPIRGWITEISPVRRMYFIQETEGRISLAYRLSFEGEGPPKIVEESGAAVPEEIMRRYVARQAAIAALGSRVAPGTNVEVLDDPERKAFLVYALAASNKPNVLVVAGHYRVTVSSDGKVKRVDALSRGLMLQERESADGNKTVAVAMSHLASPTPVETHVFSSLLYDLPFFIATSKRDQWRVCDGKIKKFTAQELAEIRKKKP